MTRRSGHQPRTPSITWKLNGMMRDGWIKCTCGWKVKPSAYNHYLVQQLADYHRRTEHGGE